VDFAVKRGYFLLIFLRTFINPNALLGERFQPLRLIGRDLSRRVLSTVF
jgi:hypothetical protein